MNASIPISNHLLDNAALDLLSIKVTGTHYDYAKVDPQLSVGAMIVS